MKRLSVVGCTFLGLVVTWPGMQEPSAQNQITVVIRAGQLFDGKSDQLFAVSGDPSKDVTEMERAKFVMKGGEVYRNDLKK